MPPEKNNRILKIGVSVAILLLIAMAVLSYLKWGNPVSNESDEPPLVFERETEKSFIKEANTGDYPETRLGQSEIERALTFEPIKVIKEYDSTSKASNLTQEHFSYTTELPANILLDRMLAQLDKLNFNVEYDDSMMELIMIEGVQGSITVSVIISKKGSDSMVGLSVQTESN